MTVETLDSILRPLVYGVLILGLLSLLIGRAFIRRRQFPHVAEALWFVTLALLVSFGLVVYMQNLRLDILQIQVEELQERVRHESD